MCEHGKGNQSNCMQAWKESWLACLYAEAQLPETWSDITEEHLEDAYKSFLICLHAIAFVAFHTFTHSYEVYTSVIRASAPVACVVWSLACLDVWQNRWKLTG